MPLQRSTQCDSVVQAQLHAFKRISDQGGFVVFGGDGCVSPVDDHSAVRAEPQVPSEMNA